MKKYILVLFFSPLLFVACDKEEVLPPTDFIMVKFENKTGKNIEDLSVSRAEIGLLEKGRTTSEYHEYETLGEQYGFALVEAVGDIEGRRYFTSSACSGVCGTDSAPDGEWLTPGYYKIAIRISDELGGNYLEFILLD